MHRIVYATRPDISPGDYMCRATTVAAYACKSGEAGGERTPSVPRLQVAARERATSWITAAATTMSSVRSSESKQTDGRREILLTQGLLELAEREGST